MKSLWLLYTLIGLGAFSISFLLQGWVFLNITSRLWFSFGVTCVLESAKITTIVLHRFMLTKNGSAIPPFVSGLTYFTKVGLVVLSLACSLAMLSDYLEAPNYKAVLERDTETAENSFERSARLLKEKEQSARTETISEIRKRYADRHDHLKVFYETRIEKEERGRDMEFNRPVNGVRKGVRWHEHVRKIESLRKDYETTTAKLRKKEDDEIAHAGEKIDAEYKSALERLNRNHQEELEKLRSAEYMKDERMKNQMVAAFLKTMENGLRVRVEYFQFIAAFSLMVSLLLESTIYIVFNFLTISHQEIFNYSEELDMDNARLKARYRSEIFRDKLHTGAFMEKVRERAMAAKSAISKIFRDHTKD